MGKVFIVAYISRALLRWPADGCLAARPREKAGWAMGWSGG